MSSENVEVKSSVGRSWMVIAVGVAICVSVLLGQTPSRLRLLGLFAIAEGVLIGVSTAYWSQRDRVVRGWRVAIAASLLGAAAFIGTSALWWRQYADGLRRAHQTPPAAMLAMQLQAESKTQSTAGKTTTLEEQKLQTQMMADVLKSRGEELDARQSIIGYLVFRLFGASSAVGIQEKATQGCALWIVELLLAGIGGAVSYRFATSEPVARSEPHGDATSELKTAGE